MKMKKRWADKQPKSGDIVLSCGHVIAPFHFWFGLTEFSRPDGTRGTATWTVCCSRCFCRLGGTTGNPDKLLIREERVWVGDDPSLKVKDEAS